LRNAISDPDLTHTGLTRFIAYSINMLSPSAAPEYAGELFYQGSQGTGVYSGTSGVSTQITAASQWTTGKPSFITPFDTAGVTINEASHDPVNLKGAVYRALTFNGSNSSTGFNTNDSSLATELPLGSSGTGGLVQDGTGKIYSNTMAYSGRPTHYYDFSTSQWKPIPNNHVKNLLALPLGNWKTREYAWHARSSGVTIFTVGYGQSVSPAEQDILAQVANATNSTANTTHTNFPYISSQPIGQQFYASTIADISNDFYQVGTAINGALTQ
jgi:hypothetical protein